MASLSLADISCLVNKKPKKAAKKKKNKATRSAIEPLGLFIPLGGQ